MQQVRATGHAGSVVAAVSLLCSLPVLAIWLWITLAGTPQTDEQMARSYLVGFMCSMATIVLSIPALIFGLVGVFLRRSWLTWLACVFSLIPIGILATATYGVIEGVTAESHRVRYSYEVLRNDSSNAVTRVRGGSGSRTVRDGFEPPDLVRGSTVRWTVQGVQDDHATFRIYWPDQLTKDIDVQLGEEVEVWSANGSSGVRITLDELDEKIATTERFIAESRERGGDPVYALIRALESPDLSIALDATRQLEAMGKGSAAVPVLVDLLQSDDRQRRIRAARGLSTLRGQARAAVPALIAALDDEYPEVADTAAIALGRIGPAAKPAVPALREFFDAQPTNDPQRMEWIIKSIGPVNPSSLPDLLAPLESELDQLRIVHQSQTNSRVPQISALLTDDDVDVRRNTALEAAKLGARADGAHSGLAKALQDSDTDATLKSMNLPVVFRDDFESDRIKPEWKLSNHVDDATVAQENGVLVMEVPTPPSGYRDLRLEFHEHIPKTDFEVSVDLRIPKGNAMSWLIVNDPEYSQHVYGSYFFPSSGEYRNWRRNDDISGLSVLVRSGFGDEQTQWHNLLLRYSAENNRIRTVLDGAPTSSHAEFNPQRPLVALQVKLSADDGSGSSRIEFDNFRLSYATPKDAPQERGSQVSTESINLQEARELVSGGDTSLLTWNRWSRLAFSHYLDRDWEGADHEARLAVENGADAPAKLARLAYLFLLAGNYREYHELCDSLIRDVESFRGSDLGQAAVIVSLNPLPPHDPDAMRQFFHSAMRRGPGYVANGKWLVDARLGNADQAIEGYQEFKQTLRIEGWPDFDLAIAYKLAGEDEAAAACLADSLRDFEDWDSPYPNHHLEMRVLRSEAERRILHKELPSIDGWIPSVAPSEE